MGDRRRSRGDLPKGAPAFVDDANRGRRTGKLIPTAPLDEDGFESIETLFGSQAYSVSAPKQRPRKQQAALTPVAERSYGDDDGSDMDITEVQDNQMDDMDDYNLPEALPAPAPLHRRPIPRRSSPGIDHVPSPRGPQYYSQTSSQSTRQAKAPRNSAIHRSHSSQRSSSPIEPEPEITSSRKSLARRSTMGGNHSVDMDVDEDSYQAPDPGLGEEELDVGSPPRHLPSPSPVPSPPKPKPKPRDVTPPPPVDDDMEDDIAAGLAEVNDGPPNSDSEPEEPPPRPKSQKENGKETKTAKDKGKGKEKAPPKRTRPDEDEEPSKSPKKPRPKPKKENAGAKAVVQTVGGKRKKRDFNAATPPNVRRSQRERFSPLEWWRNEKFVYGRSPDPEEGPLLVPLIRAIERPPKPPPVALSKKKGGRRTVKVKKEEDDGALRLDGDGVFGAPRTAEDGMDEETEELGVVLDYATGREVERRIAFPGARVEFTPTEGPFHFQKIFGDSDFFAAGVMKIPVGGRKPNKPSKENTFVFYCVSGAVEVKVHKSTFVIAPGGMFLAPREYFLLLLGPARFHKHSVAPDPAINIPRVADWSIVPIPLIRHANRARAQSGGRPRGTVKGAPLHVADGAAIRGNSYTIANVSQRDAYIFFAQSRKVLDDSDEPPPLPQPRESLGGSKTKAKVVQKKS